MNPINPITPNISFADYIKTYDPNRTVAGDPVKVKAEPSQYDAGFILPQANPEAALNEHRAYMQPWEDKLGNGLANMTISAFTGALESTVGLAYGAAAALASGNASKFYNNEFGKTIDSMNEYVRESNPFYYSKAEQEASLLSSMGTSNFWFDKVLGGAGYTIGSLATGYGAARLFNMGKTARLAQLAADANAAEAAGGLTAEAAKFARWDMAKQIALAGTMAHGESSMEARQTYEETKQKYSDLHAQALANPSDRNLDAYRNLTDQKIEGLASDAADSNYLMNMAITGPTDLILLGKFINPGKKAAVRTYNEIGKRTAVGGATEYFDKVATQKARSLMNAGSSFLKGFTTEGAQEGLQYASNIAAQEFVESHGIQGQEWFKSFLSGMGEGLGETLSSKEGLESILVGGLVGGPFGLKGARAERVAQDARTKKLVDAMNADPLFLQSNPVVKDFLSATNNANKSEDYLKQGDVFNAKNKADIALNTYIKSQLDNGTADYFVERLNSLKEMDQSELDKYFGPGTTTQQIDQVIEKVGKLNELNESIETLYGTPGGTEEQKQQNAQLRERLFFSAATIKDVEGRMNNITKELAGMGNAEVNAVLAARQNAIGMHKTVTPETTPKDKMFDEYLKEMQAQAVENYNALVKQFAKDNPVEASQAMQLLADLNQLDERKQDFIKYYNELNDPEKARALLEKDAKILNEAGNAVVAATNKEQEFLAQGRTTIEDIDTLLPLNKDRSNEVQHKGQTVDLAKMSAEEFADFKRALEDDFQSTGEDISAEMRAAINKEDTTRTDTTQVRLQVKEALTKATTPEEVDDIVANIQKDTTFSVNQEQIDKLKKSLADAMEAKRKQVEAIETIKNNFKGENEFFHSFPANQSERENLEKATALPDIAKRTFFRIARNPNPNVITNIGNEANNTLNPRLKKLTPDVIIETWVEMPDGSSVKVGSMPWFGQYVNYSGNPIDIQNLTFEQYVTLFLPGTTKESAETFIAQNPERYNLEAFKAAHRAMYSLYVGAQQMLGTNQELVLTPGQTKSLAGVSLSQGNYVFADESLASFQEPSTVNKPLVINGTPVIISTSSYDGSVQLGANKEIVADNYMAGVLDADGVPVTIDPGTGQIRPELLPALNALGQRISNAKVGETIYNKYWMLVEDAQGTIKIPGSDLTYDWRPVSARQYTAEESDKILKDLKDLADKRKGLKDASEINRHREAFKGVARSLFVAIPSPDAIKSFKQVYVYFGINKDSKLNVQVEIELKTPQKGPNGEDIYRGRVFMTVPDNVVTTQDFISWFNKEIQKEQQLSYETGSNTYGKVAFNFAGRLAPITSKSMRMNFTSTGGSQTKSGLKQINPSNVWESFSVNVSRLAPRENQKLVVHPVVTAASQAMGNIVQTAPAPVPITTLPPGLTSGAQTTAPVSVMTKEELNQVWNDIKNGIPVDPFFEEFAQGVGSQYLFADDLVTWFEQKTGTKVGMQPASAAPVSDAAKIADIERRRQERLNKLYKESVEKEDREALDKIYHSSKVGDQIQVGEYIFTKTAEDEWTSSDDVGTFRYSTEKMGNIYFDIEYGKNKESASLAFFAAKLNLGKASLPQKDIADFPLIKEIQKIEDDAKQELAALGTTPAAPARTSRSRKSGGAGYTGANSIGAYDESEVIDRETAIGNIRSLLPDFISIQELDEAFAKLRDGRYTFGSFYNNVIKLAGKVVKGREFHEAFHALFRTMLTDAQIDALYKDAKNLMIAQFKKEGKSFVQAYGEWKLDRIDYEHLPENVKKDLFIEEWMADEYPKWREGKSVVPAKPTTLIGRFFDLLKKIGNWFMGTPTVGEFFQAIDEGKFSGNKSQVMNRFTDPTVNTEARSQIYVGDREGVDGNEYASFLDPAMQMVLVNTIVSNVQAKRKSSGMTDAQIIEMEMLELADRFDVDSESFDAIAEDPAFSDVFEKVRDLDFLFRNDDVVEVQTAKGTEQRNFGEEARKMFLDDVFKKLREFGNDETGEIDDNPTAADESTDGDTNVTERNFDLNFENKGGFTSLSKFLRKYISTTTYTTSLDEFFGLEPGTVFGDEKITVAVNPKKVYNGLTKITANQGSAAAILRKMQYLAQEPSESGKFIAKFFADAGITFENNELNYDKDHEALIQTVVKGFSNYSVNYLFTQFDRRFGDKAKPFARIFAANRRNMDTQQIQEWNAQFTTLAKRNTREEMQRRAETISELNALILTGKISDEQVESISTGLKRKLQAVGISLSKTYLKYLLLQNRVQRSAAQDAFITEFEKSVVMNATQVHESLQTVMSMIVKGRNPFVLGQELSEEEKSGKVSTLRKIAMDNAIFDENVNIQTMVNADGKNIYPYQKANYHIQRIFELKEIDFTAVDPETGELLYPSELHNEIPNRDFILGNYLLSQPEFVKMLKTLQTERIDGLKQTSLEKNDEGDLKVKLDGRDRDGATYGSMTTRELLLQMYSLFADSSTDTTQTYTAQDGTRQTQAVSARRSVFNIMEASNTLDVLNMPVHTLFVDGKLTDRFKNAVLAEVKREADRIAKVREGAYVDQYVNFNSFTSKPRGLQFWENKELLKAAGVKEALESGQMTFEEAAPSILKAMDAHFAKELQEHMEYLGQQGILRNEDGKLVNRLLPAKFEGLGIEEDAMFNTSLTDNINNAYLNMYINSMAINQVLMGDPALTLKDPTDWFKRAKGNNAAGDNLTHFNPNNNGPVRTLVFGRQNDKGEFDDFVNTEYVKQERIYKKGSKEYKDFANSLPEAEREAFLAKSPEEIKVGDAQAYTTVNGLNRFMTNLGRMTTEGSEIYNRIAAGEKISAKDWKYLKENGLMLNSQKLVYYDGISYVKMSIVPLTPEYTTKPDGTAIKGMEFLHNLRVQMEANGIDMAGQPSMMKKMIKNPLVLGEGQSDFMVDEKNIQNLDVRYLRLQQENPSNKIEIKDPTQMLHIIAAEHEPTTSIYFPWDPKIDTVGKLVKWYDDRLAERVNTQMIPAREFLTQLQEGKRSVNTKRIVKAFRNILESTGASQQLLDYLRVDDAGYPVENFNLPNVVTAFEQHFNTYFNKVFSQKVAGYKTTLQSGFGHKLIYNKNTGKIITRNEYLQDPAKYDNDPDVDTRRLGFDVPHYVNGKEVFKYSEIVLPYHFAEQFGLKPGDEIPEDIAYLFGTRIPSQDKHSARVLKIVDILPPSYGSNMIMPDELILLTGSDFDVDSYFNQRPDHYVKDGRFMLYGNNEDSKWEQFQRWHRKNNKFLNDVAKEFREDNPGMSDEEALENAFKALGLPSTEEKFTKSDLRNPGEINNDLLYARMVLHSNPSMNDINKTPATLEAIQNKEGTGVLDKRARDLGYASWKELEVTMSPNSPTGMVKAFETNKAGSKAIGAAVNNTQVYAVLTRFGLMKNKSSATAPVIINGVEVGEISPSEFKTFDGKRIMDILSTLTSSMTDNAKYGYNSKMNMDINTLSVVSLLEMNKLQFDVAIAFINSEAVKDYAKRSQSYAIQTQEETEYQGNADEIILRELEKKILEMDPTLLERMNTLGSEPVTQDDLDISNEFSPDRKAYVEANPTGKTALDNQVPVEYYMAQYRILSNYAVLANKHVPEFIAFSQLMKLTKGVSSSTKETSFKGDEEIKSYLDKLNLKLERTREGWKVEYKDTSEEAMARMVYDFKDIVNNHKITMQNLAVFGEKSEIQKEYFISQSDFAKDVKTMIFSNLNSKLGMKKRRKAAQDINLNLGAYLMFKAWRHQSGIKENMNAYLFDEAAEAAGIKNMVDLKEEIIKQNPDLEKNLVFTQVFFNNKNGITTAKYNTFSKGQKGFEGLLLGEMRRLANSEARPLVHQMIKYMIAKEAMLFKNDSPISLINPSTLSTYNFSDMMTRFTPVLNGMNEAQYKEMFGVSRVELMQEFTELFMRDVNNSGYVASANQDLITHKDKKATTVNPVSTGKDSFSFNYDAGYNMVDEETGEESKPDDETKARQARRNNAIASNFGFTLTTASYTAKNKQVKQAKAFEFPRFIRIKNTLYKLKSYVPVDKRYDNTDARYSTAPDNDGKFIGVAVQYERVDRFGGKFNGVTITPYGRTVPENQEFSFEKMVEKAKASKALPQPEVEDTDNEVVDETMVTPLPQIGTVPTSMPQNAANPLTSQPDTGSEKEQQQATDAAKNLAMLSMNSNDADMTSKDNVVTWLQGVKNIGTTMAFVMNIGKLANAGARLSPAIRKIMEGKETPKEKIEKVIELVRKASPQEAAELDKHRC